MEEEVLEICESVDNSIDYSSTALIDDELIDMDTLMEIVSVMSDEYDISIPNEEIIPENFNSISAMAALLEKYL